jgi:peroxiredoxin
MTRQIVTRLIAAAFIASTGLALSGCATDPLAAQYRSGTTKNYIAGDGRTAEFALSQRGPAVEFTGTMQDGSTVTSSDYAGKVLVVNFWYAACPPCRAEAPDLEKVYTEFAGQEVDFLGVNVRDQAATAESFERTFGITYPSTIDANTGSMQLAFSGKVAPNAVPTTLVLDKQGRVSARILGKIPDASVLRALIISVLAEKAP